MTNKFHEDVKQLMRGKVLQTRAQISLSQEKMSLYLGISPRSLASIESGEYCCSLDTFLLYCFYFRHEVPVLFANIFDIIENHMDDGILFFDFSK